MEQYCQNNKIKLEKNKMKDWRLQGQDKFLKGVKLFKKKYKKFREDWEHDHCEFCGAKFSELDSDLNEGYSTKDEYHWICPACYKDFKDLFQWKVISK
jgi:hypothetical protein